MGHNDSSIPHPHLARRGTAAVAALFCLVVWFMIYSALWQAHVARTWVHHAILLAGGAGAVMIPCLAVWLLAHGYDRFRQFRGF